MPLVEIKDFNALIDEQSIKNKQEAYEQLVKMSRSSDYITENFLNYLYHQNYYELIGTDLSRLTNTTISQQINSTEKLEDNGAAMFSIAEKNHETNL